jgi:hypothetical protein
MGKGADCSDPKCAHHMHIKTCGGEWVKVGVLLLTRPPSALPQGGGGSCLESAGRSRPTAAGRAAWQP